MRRRTFMTACSCGLAAAAGCLSPGTAPQAEDRHPLADSTLSVRVDDDSETPHDVEQIANESLAFWEEHSQEYVGFDVAFERGADEPDLVIAYGDDPTACADLENYSERVLGCAPLIRPGNRVRRPVTAHVVAGHRPTGKIRVTTKHELGHIFGLDHDDEPLWIMSNRPADRIPLYEVRIEIYETVVAARDHGGDANRQFNDGTEAWRDDAYQTSEERFRSAHDAYGEMRASIATAQERATEFDGHERVETVNRARLRELLGRLYRRASAAEWFAFHMAEASQGARDGDRATVESALAEANDWIREYNAVEHGSTSPDSQARQDAVETTEVRDIAIALGLVRGFDRDEPVLDEEEEEFDVEG